MRGSPARVRLASERARAEPGLRSTWSNIWSRRDLLKELVTSELKSDRANTTLGWLWWFLDPLLMMLSYWLVFTLLLGRGRPSYQPYPIFVLCSLVTWKHIASSIGRATRVVRGKERLIKSVPFPTMILPLSVSISGFVFFVVGLLVCAAASAVWPNATWSGNLVAVTQIGGLMLLQLLLTGGLSLVFAALGVIIRDLGELVAHILRIGFYLSPGLYGVELVQEACDRKFGAELGNTVFQLYMFNPAAMLIDGYRRALLYGTPVPARYWILLFVQGAVLVWVGNRIYQYYDRRIIKFL